MKKSIVLLMLLVLIIGCFTSCDIFEEKQSQTTMQEPNHEHTWEYVQYETGHFKQYTCGCPSPDIMGEHVNADADLFCDVCGYHLSVNTESCDHQWDEGVEVEGGIGAYVMEYTCTLCGSKNREVILIPPENHFLRNQAGCEWMYEITADDIKEIKMHSGGGGPLPPISLTYISSSTDEAVISNIFEQYYWLDISPMDGIPGVCDGGYYTVQFILNNGDVKQLSFLIGKYFEDKNGNCFRILDLPTFRDGTEYISYYGIESFDNYGDIWNSTGETRYAVDIPIEEFEFVRVIDDIELDGRDVTYYLELESGRLNFLTESYFYIDDNREVYYQLVGKNLDEIIDEYKDKYSVTMNDEDWLYEDLKPKYKAGEEVSVKLMIPYDLGFLLFVNEERVMYEESSNYNYCEFIFTMPECDVVIDVKSYGGFLPDYNYAVLIETYWEKIPKADSVSVIHYYGEYDSGAIAAMMQCSEIDYDCALWDEIIDGVVIHYSNGNRIIVLYEGEFYNLTTAYENGYITKDDLQDICDLQNQFLGWIEEE